LIYKENFFLPNQTGKKIKIFFGGKIKQTNKKTNKNHKEHTQHSTENTNKNHAEKKKKLTNRKNKKKKHKLTETIIFLTT